MHKIFPLIRTNGDIIDDDSNGVIGCWSRMSKGVYPLPAGYYQAEILGYKSPAFATLDEVKAFIVGVARVINKVHGH